MDLTSTKFASKSNMEEKADRKLPGISKELEHSESASSNIKYISAQNFHKAQQNFTQGLTLEQYFNKNYPSNDEFEENKSIKFNNPKLNVLNSKITEQSELSFENSEKKYMDASFEINESDEDLYNNSDSNSNISKTKKSDKKSLSKKNYQNLDKVIENEKVDDHLDIKLKIEEKYKKTKKNLKKQNSQKLETNETMPLRDYDKKYSLKVNKNFEEEKTSVSLEKTEKSKNKNQNECKENNEGEDQRENRMKNANKTSKKIYNSQSPPHSHLLQNNIERRNFSKDTFAKYSHEDKNHNYSSKENIENHIAYRNSYDPNKTHFLGTGHFQKRKEEDNKFSNLQGYNNEMNKSSYNIKSRLTLNEFYKNQSKYQDFGNPMGPPPKMKSWNSSSNESDFEKKYFDKEIIKEKMKNEDINFISKYASKFRLNDEECKIFS